MSQNAAKFVRKSLSEYPGDRVGGLDVALEKAKVS
jgi:hypothetical protein